LYVPSGSVAYRVRHLLWLTALLLPVAGCVPVPPDVTPPGPVVLTVMTWNMGGGRGELPRLLDDLESGRLTGSPSPRYVVLLQEAADGGQRDVRTLVGARAASVHVTPVRHSDDRTTGNAIVSTLPLDEIRVIALPRERQPRAAAAATIAIGGQRLFVVSAHLENRLGWTRGLFGDRARGRQAAALIQQLPAGAFGIVGGDMNTMFGSSEPAWRALRARFPDTPSAAAATFRDRLVLDHLFFDLPDGWQATTTVAADDYGSDHHPVVATIIAHDAASAGSAAPDLRPPRNPASASP
jgi:endonuclease/exonuclease/phosphatase family metal-dependent hydrolase